MDTSMFKLSKYIHPFIKDGNIALWNSLSMSKVYGGKALKEAFTSLSKFYGKKIDEETLKKYPPLIIKELQAGNFLIEANHDEENDFSQLVKKSEEVDLTNLVLLITDSCNFNCTYCQIEKNIIGKTKTHMSYDIADKAIELLKRSSVKDSKKTITITGGEPLLNFDTLKFIVEKTNRDISNKRIVVFTNGYLMDEDKAKFFKENKVLVLISLDGPEMQHDVARKLENGSGTFSKVLESYKLLKKYGVDLGISAVAGNHNISDLQCLIDFFVDLRPSSIGLNFSHRLLYQNNIMEISISDFGRELIKFYKEMRKRNIFVENISRVVKSFSTSTPRFHECQAEGSGFTVNANGKIGPCKSLLVTDIYALDINTVKAINNTELFIDWSKRTPLKIPGCKGCPALMICGGGCAYDSYIINNQCFKKPDERVCAYHKNVLEFLIWDLFDGIKDKVINKDIYSVSHSIQESIFNKYYDQRNEIQRSVGHEN